MPGTYELRLISRYFGGVRAHWASMDAVPGVSMTSAEVHAGDEHGAQPKHHQHMHHLTHKTGSRPSYTHGASDEDMMQVLFKKLSSERFQGPTRQGLNEHSKPDH